MSLIEASFCGSFFSWGIVIGLPLYGWICGRLAGSLSLLASGAAVSTARSYPLEDQRLKEVQQENDGENMRDRGDFAQ
jgi:hypothetical protein